MCASTVHDSEYSNISNSDQRKRRWRYFMWNEVLFTSQLDHHRDAILKLHFLTIASLTRFPDCYFFCCHFILLYRIRYLFSFGFSLLFFNFYLVSLEQVGPISFRVGWMKSGVWLSFYVSTLCSEVFLFSFLRK